MVTLANGNFGPFASIENEGGKRNFAALLVNVRQASNERTQSLVENEVNADAIPSIFPVLKELC